MTKSSKLILMAAVATLICYPAISQTISLPNLPDSLPSPNNQNTGMPSPLPAPIADPIGSGTNALQIPQNPIITPGQSLDLEQKAWQNPTKHKSKRQSKPGFLRVNWRPDDIIQVNAREGLLSVIKFPKDEQIIMPMVSDPKSFEVAIAPNKRSLSIRGIYPGVDGNLIVYGASNNVYTFYLRSLPYNSDTLPDTTVEMVVGGMDQSTGETLSSTAPISEPYANYNTLFEPSVVAATKNFDRGAKEFARIAGIKPENMRNNITIKAQDEASRAIAPVRVWHDGRFTYLDFGPNAASMNQWPVASLIVQNVESPVGTRTVGQDRSLMVVEAVGNITLRNGNHLICLILDTPQNDTRYAVNEMPAPAIKQPPASPPEAIRSAKPTSLPKNNRILQAPLPVIAAKATTDTLPRPAVISAPKTSLPAKQPEPVAPKPAEIKSNHTTTKPEHGETAPKPELMRQIPSITSPSVKDITQTIKLGPYSKEQSQTVLTLLQKETKISNNKSNIKFTGGQKGSLIISGISPEIAKKICDIRKNVGDTCTLTNDR